MYISEMTKRCTECGEEKDLSFFNRDKTGKLGFAAKCRSCRCKSQGVWRSKNKEHLKEYQANNYTYNKEKEKIKYEKKYEKNKEKILARQKSKPNYYEIRRKMERDARKEINDRYIKHGLRRKGISAEEISKNPEWLNIQKTIIKIKRKIKSNGNNNTP